MPIFLHPKRIFLVGMIIILFSISSKSFSQEAILFGQQGTRHTIPTGKFSKWDDMLRRWHKTQGLVDNNCEEGLFTSCYLHDLQELVSKIKQESPWKRIKIINDFVNQTRYKEDKYVYDVNDYWAIPQEFFGNEMGDCEDYSISKYFALKAAGIKVDDLQIAIVKDININIYHAILIVKYAGENYVLDNRLYDVISNNKIKHYQLIYTINENNWWLY